MDKALSVQGNTDNKMLVAKPDEDLALQLLPKFKEKKSGIVRKQNILEEDAYVQVIHDLELRLSMNLPKNCYQS